MFLPFSKREIFIIYLLVVVVVVVIVVVVVVVVFRLLLEMKVRKIIKQTKVTLEQHMALSL